jgi:hypothetical protein
MTAVLSSPVRHRFCLEILHGNRRIHEVHLETRDFDRAVEAAFIEGLRRGEFSRYAPPFDSARVEPCFEGDGPNAPAF